MTARALILVWILTAAPVAGEETPTLESCERERLADPGDMDAYVCFHRLTRSGGGLESRETIVAHLEGLLDAEPDNTHALWMLGRVLSPRDPRALEMFDRALEDYTARNDAKGQGWVHAHRSRVLMVNMRLDESAADAEAALSRAERIDDFGLRAYVLFQRSRIEMLRGDEGKVFGLLRAVALDSRFDTLTPAFRSAVLNYLGSVCVDLNLRHTALRYLQRAEALALEHDNRAWVGEARNTLSTLAMNRFHLGEITRDEALEIAQAALDVADNEGTRLYAEMRVAELTAGDEGIRRLRELAARQEETSHATYEVLTALGTRLLTAGLQQAGEAVEPLEGALEAARKTGHTPRIARALSNLALARLEVEPLDDALQSALRSMDAIEGLHDPQSGDTIGALAFSVYSQIYYATVGKLLADPTYEHLELALRIGERMRSRSLIEHLGRTVGAAAGSDWTTAERRAVLEKISEAQMRLIVGKLTDGERRRAEADLERLEEEEVLLRASIERDRPVRPEVPEASIEIIQRELKGDEALLSFLVTTPGRGGSWLMVVTSTDVHAYPLPPQRDVDTATRFWLGLLQRGDGSEREPASRLYRDLLSTALRELPAGTTRLIVIPDGSLHRIPFDALRESTQGPALVEHFEITRVPSARVWLHLRGFPVPAGTGSALFLADPAFPRATLEQDAVRAFRFADVAIGRLPFARREVRAAVRSLGNGETRIGEEAHEAFLKHADLSRYRVIHFAAHALIDEDSPDRSAILLSPGDDTEDGLLQAREVLDLDLPGSMVTLSACHSAGGRVVTGEGVMGLARSFFQAGASVVVGGLWPLQDDATADLMESFYRHLGDGLSTGAALARAKREMARKGAPASAWAGVVILGDGDKAAWRDGPDRNKTRSILYTVLLATVLIAVSVWIFLRTRVA